MRTSWSRVGRSARLTPVFPHTRGGALAWNFALQMQSIVGSQTPIRSLLISTARKTVLAIIVRHFARPPCRSVNYRGFPLRLHSALRGQQHGRNSAAQRLSVELAIGNSWATPVVCYLLYSLLRALGMVAQLSVQDLVDRLVPGKGDLLPSLLLRLR